MAYTDIVNVREVLPEGVKVDSTTTKPTLAAVEKWILEGSAELDVACYAVGISVPVTDANAVLKFRKMLTREVVYQIYASRGSEEEGGKRPFWADWHKDWVDFLAMIAKGGLAAIAADDSGPLSETMDAEENPDDTEANPKIDWGTFGFRT